MKIKEQNSKELVHIGSIINKVLQTCRRESGDELLQVWSLWNSAVGEVIAKNAQPAAFKETTLLVHVTSSVWIHQLQFLKKNIIIQVNDALGKELVEEMKFKIGPI